MKNEIITIELNKNEIQSLLPLLDRIEQRITTSYNLTTDTLEDIRHPYIIETQDHLRETQELIWTLQNFIEDTTQTSDQLTYLSLD